MKSYNFSQRIRNRIFVSNLSNRNTLIFILLLIIGFSYISVSADSVTLNGKSYQGENNSTYSITNNYEVKKMSYGRGQLGPVILSRGNASGTSTSKDGIAAYSSKNTISIKYSFSGNFKSDNKDVWQIVSDNGKIVNNITIDKKIQDGVLIIRKSTDGKQWDYAIDPITNFFSNGKIDRNNLYTISLDELKVGTYFEIYIAYKIQRRTDSSKVLLVFDNDTYSYRYCLEYYKFYAYYEGNPIEFKDITTGKNISSGSSVSAGFIVNKNGSSYLVKISKDGGTSAPAADCISVVEPGNYDITITDPVRKAYSYQIIITNGMSLRNGPTATLYRNEKKSGYRMDFSVGSTTGNGLGSHTTLKIGQTPVDAAMADGTVNGIKAYGIMGEGVHLYLHLRDNIGGNWEIVSDNYGSKESEKIGNIELGKVPVKSGLLIIQTSTDNRHYSGINTSRYASGLHTSDFEAYYKGKGDVLIYSPSGKDILNGLYIKVIYAYEIKNSSQKTDLRCIDIYTIYLCSDNLGAVTFHNLSTEEIIEAELDGYDEATAEVYKHAETMLSGAYSVSGFSIDKKFNPVVTYTIALNNQNINAKDGQKFTESGKYVITLKSPVNTKKQITLYVDTMTDQEALEYYFGESFIRGKRIYSEGEYPVYEGGKTSYYLLGIDDFHVPLTGTIKNLTTGESIHIEPNREGIQGELITPGEYIAVFSTNPNFESDLQSGDSRNFIFHFRIIASGTAPGPVINQKNLAEYAHTTITDSYPVYYGLTYASSTKGHITLAFVSEEEAIRYAERIESGMVEQQDDGSYRYTGSFIIKQKEKYESNWDLMDAIQFFAKEAVQVYYFDNSEVFTILSLSDELINNTENIRRLELDRSVFLFGEGQKPLLTKLDALPIISPKPYHYLEPGIEGKVVSGYNDFEFISDQYRCDSDSVLIIDSGGKEYPIEYNEGVGKQLASMDCPSGIVTIRETTIYGDTNEYQAVYIASGENTSSLELTIVTGENRETRIFSQADTGTIITADAFAIASLSDELDPYNLVIVKNKYDNTKNVFFVADKIPNQYWIEPGEYSISAINRLGYKYSIDVSVQGTDSVTLQFNGIGTDTLQDIQTEFGAENVKLPSLSRYGYDFLGFEDANGKIYTDEINEILFKGSAVLNAVWKAKEFNLTILDSDGVVITTELVRFGDEYVLPVSETNIDGELVSWTMNGRKILGDSLVIDKEEDIVLVKSVAGAINLDETTLSDSSITMSSESLDDNNETSGNINLPIAICIIGGLLAVVAVFIYNRKKKASNSGQTTNDHNSKIIMSDYKNDSKKNKSKSNKKKSGKKRG